MYYGTASRVYNQALGNGSYVTNTTSTVSSLPPGNTYYFAVTAIDASGAESAFSNEGTKQVP